MGQTAQIRKILPVSQVVLAVFLGGWGEWLRYSALNRPLFLRDWVGFDSAIPCLALAS